MHSLSPVMHNAAFAAAGLDAVYVPLPTDDFDDFLAFAEAMGVEGASVTIPFKLDALRAAAAQRAAWRARSERPTRCGEARRGWEATNTDVDGFLAPLEAAFDGAARRRARLGARRGRLGACGRGGAASRRARASRCTRAAAEQARERGGAARLRRRAVAAAPGSWDLLVNARRSAVRAAATSRRCPAARSRGASSTTSPTAPGDSALLREARRAGCRDARRPADAGGAGRAAVRVVDRASGRGPGVMESGRA